MRVFMLYVSAFRGDMWDEMWNSVGLLPVLTRGDVSDAIGTYFAGGEL